MGKDAKKLSQEVDKIRQQFCHNVVRNIVDKFPKETVDVAMAFHTLGMPTLSFLSKEQTAAYGSQEL